MTDEQRPAGPQRMSDEAQPAGAQRASRKGRAATPREIELKYAVRDAAALRTWLAGDWVAGAGNVRLGEERTVGVEDRYIDTLHGALHRQGFGARIRRREGGPPLLTVKSVASTRDPAAAGSGPRSRALTRRVEVEGPAGERLDPETWPASPARELVDELRGAGRLRTLFVVSQQRGERSIETDEGPLMLTLDDVTVLRGKRLFGSFSALEIEARGDGSGTAALERLAALLEASGLVEAEPRSKEEIAQGMVAEALAHPVHRAPRVPRATGIRPDDSLAEAGRKALHMHLARMLSHEAGTRAGEDIEELHKMRVATRRMRAAWRVFDGAYRPRLQRRYVRELRTVATALGTVRDLDVLLEGLGTYLATLPETGQAAMEPLRQGWQRQRERARTELIGLLDSRDYRDFVEDYLDFVETPGAGELRLEPGLPVLVRDTAAGRIWSAYEHVRAHDALLAWADVPALHALRIDGKRLRYTLEFFAEVLPSSVTTIIGTVTAMQDHLGLLNDADVAAGLTRSWLNANASRSGSETRQAVSLYLASREAEIARLRRTFPPLWRRITGRPFRRSLALAVASL